MKKIAIHSELFIIESIDALDAESKTLMLSAIEARKNAYAPYSKFQVGAAILLANEAIVIGSNQENAAYPSGLCAERVAIFQAGALYPNVEILKIAITATSLNNPVLSPIPPCGACRQSMAEYEIKQEKPIQIYFMGENGEVHLSSSLKNLLPFGFEKKYL
ncbi:MAG: cytidine deaminase [Flavobacterium sp.]